MNAVLPGTAFFLHWKTLLFDKITDKAEPSAVEIQPGSKNAKTIPSYQL